MVLFHDTCYTSCPEGYAVDSTGVECQKVIPNNTGSGVGNYSGGITVPANKSYLYFPVLTTQTIMGGVSVGSWLKDSASLISSNAMGMWGPLEFVAYGGQIGLSYMHIA